MTEADQSSMHQMFPYTVRGMALVLRVKQWRRGAEVGGPGKLESGGAVISLRGRGTS
jgi:hypothetical protein